MGLSLVGCSTNQPESTFVDQPAAESQNENSVGSENPPDFIDTTPRTVKQFIPKNGQEAGQHAVLETLGTGVALLDYDNNGLWDLCLPGGGKYDNEPKVIGLPSALFRHEQWEQYENVTSPSGLQTDLVYSHAAIPGDYDNDGFQDLLFTGYGNILLFFNNGDGTFDEVSHHAQLVNQAWSTAAAWGDINRDSVPDLYLVNYLNWSLENNPECYQAEGRDSCSPTKFSAISDRLFLGNGDGTFRDASLEAELVEGGKGLGVAIADLDLDGDVDLYVTNDTTPNFLYRNDDQGKLTEIGLQSGTALSDTAEADGSMGVDVGDLNLDGLPDLWVTNYEEQSNALYRNMGNNYFEHVSNQFGVAAVGTIYVGFGTLFFDYDCDSDEDIFVTNGHVMLHARNSPYKQRPLLLENRDGKQVINVADTAGDYFKSSHVGRGVASSDLDNDGDLDLVTTHSNSPAVLLTNQTKQSGNWLRLHLIGVQSNRDAIGARIKVETAQGMQVRQIKGGTSFLSSSDLRCFLGVGNTSEIKQISILWPSGTEQILKSISANQTMTIIEK